MGPWLLRAERDSGAGLPNDNHCWNDLLVGKSEAFFAANECKSTPIGRDRPAISDAS